MFCFFHEPVKMELIKNLKFLVTANIAKFSKRKRVRGDSMLSPTNKSLVVPTSPSAVGHFIHSFIHLFLTYFHDN